LWALIGGGRLEESDRPDAAIEGILCMRRFVHESRYELHGLHPNQSFGSVP